MKASSYNIIEYLINELQNLPELWDKKNYNYKNIYKRSVAISNILKNLEAVFEQGLLSFGTIN